MPRFKSSQKAMARYLYFHTDSTQKEIANAVKVNEKTMTAWVRNGAWADHKKAAYYSPDQQVQNLYEELRQIDNKIKGREDGERFGNKEETEARAKLLNLIVAHAKNPVDKWRNQNRRFAMEQIQAASEEDGEKRYQILFYDDHGNYASSPSLLPPDPDDPTDPRNRVEST